MEFKRSELKVTIYGQEVTIAYPTLRQLKEFNKKANKKGADDLEETISFLAVLGLPKHIAEELEPEHFTKIMETVTAKKS